MSGKITVDKLQAAHAQVRAAIELWADGDNPIAVHTLIAAAHEIVHALYIRKGLQDLLLDSDWIKPEFLPLWRSRIRERANFFKHADRDPDAAIELDPEVNELHIMFTLVGLHRMGEEVCEEGLAFMRWIEFNRPNLMKVDLLGQALPAAIIEQFRQYSRREFLDGFKAYVGRR